MGVIETRGRSCQCPLSLGLARVPPAWPVGADDEPTPPISDIAAVLPLLIRDVPGGHQFSDWKSMRVLGAGRRVAGRSGPSSFLKLHSPSQRAQNAYQASTQDTACGTTSGTRCRGEPRDCPRIGASVRELAHQCPRIRASQQMRAKVGVPGLEPGTSWSQTMRATDCATPRDGATVQRQG